MMQSSCVCLIMHVYDCYYYSLDPVIVHRPLSMASLTCLTFAHNSKVSYVAIYDRFMIIQQRVQ